MQTPHFKYFRIGSNANIESIAMQRREWAKKLHPDKGGNATEFVEMDREYARVLLYLKQSAIENKTNANTTKKGGTNNKELINDIQSLLNDFMNNPQSIEIERIKTVGSRVNNFINRLLQ